MRASVPQGSKDSIMAGGSLWTERKTMLKTKSVFTFANNRIMVGLRTFQSTLIIPKI